MKPKPSSEQGPNGYTAAAAAASAAAAAAAASAAAAGGGGRGEDGGGGVAIEFPFFCTPHIENFCNIGRRIVEHRRQTVFASWTSTPSKNFLTKPLTT